ncbi:MAG TPA: CAP domain-containing protein [Marinagarivorans sp.]
MSQFFKAIFTAVIFAGLAACGSSDDAPADGTAGGSMSSLAPVNSSSSASSSVASGGFAAVAQWPASNADRIALTSTINIQFNAEVMANSYSRDLITVTRNAAAVAGNLQYLGDGVFEFTPANLLAPDTVYSVAVSSEVMSEDGTAPASYQWQFTTVGDVYTTSQAIIDQCMSERDIAMLDAVNQLRAAGYTCNTDGVSALKPPVRKLNWHCDLQQAAQKHSDDMAKNNFFSHTGSDGSNVGSRVNQAGFSWRTVAENIAAGNAGVAATMEQWKTSEAGHCDALMSGNFTVFGSGYASSPSSQYRYYWTQNFAAPR